MIEIPQLDLDEFPHLDITERRIWRFYFEVKYVSSKIITIHIPSRQIDLDVKISKFPVQHIKVGDYFFGKGNKDVKKKEFFIITEIEKPEPIDKRFAKMMAD